jgi:hypothetical protein
LLSVLFSHSCSTNVTQTLQEDQDGGSSAMYRVAQGVRRCVVLPPGSAAASTTRMGVGDQRSIPQSSERSMPIDLASSPEGAPRQQPSKTTPHHACVAAQCVNKSWTGNASCSNNVHLSPGKRHAAERDQDCGTALSERPVHTQQRIETIEID